MKSTIHAKLLLEVQGGISILDKKNDLNTLVALGWVKGLHNFKKSYVLIVFLLCLPHPDICEQVPQRGISVLLQELVRRVQCMVTQSSADVTQVL